MIRFLLLLVFFGILDSHAFHHISHNSLPGQKCILDSSCGISERCDKLPHRLWGVCVPVSKASKKFHPADPCTSNSDCGLEPGWVCMIRPGFQVGHCLGVLLPQPIPEDPFQKLLAEKSCLVDCQCPAHQICHKPTPSTSGKCVPQGLPPGNRMLLDDKCTVNSECNAGEKCVRLPGNVRGICVPADKFRRFQPIPDDPSIVMPEEVFY